MRNTIPQTNKFRRLILFIFVAVVDTSLLAETHVVAACCGVLPEEVVNMRQTKYSPKTVQSLLENQALFRHPAEDVAHGEVQAGFPLPSSGQTVEKCCQSIKL
jgi:hypothetical protein